MLLSYVLAMGSHKYGRRYKTLENSWNIKDSMDELERLCETAGLVLVGREYQTMQNPSPSTFIGAGKLEEIVALVHNASVAHVIFDDELSPAQGRNIQKALGPGVQVRSTVGSMKECQHSLMKGRLCSIADPSAINSLHLNAGGAPKFSDWRLQVLDRTQLILQIFSQRARTREAKLQVPTAPRSRRCPRRLSKPSRAEMSSSPAEISTFDSDRAFALPTCLPSRDSRRVGPDPQMHPPRPPAFPLFYRLLRPPLFRPRPAAARGAPPRKHSLNDTGRNHAESERSGTAKIGRTAMKARFYGPGCQEIFGAHIFSVLRSA